MGNPNRRLIGAALAMSALVGCSGGGSVVDAGVDTGVDAGCQEECDGALDSDREQDGTDDSADAGTDNGADGAADGIPDGAADGMDGDAGPGDPGPGDLDLGEDFGLWVPAGARVCSSGQMHFDVFAVYRTNARVSFRPGLVRLPRQSDTVQVDWIDKVELGPDRTVLVPLGPGEFRRTVETTPQGETYHYEFHQAFDAGGPSYRLVLREDFVLQGGQAVEPLVVFDEAYLTQVDWSRALTLYGFLDADFLHSFTSCTFESFLPQIHHATVSNGDRIQFELRWPGTAHPSCMEACQMGLVGATFERGGERREIADSFRLGFTDGQHNWNRQVLAVFDAPVGTTRGFWLREDQVAAPPTAVRYLDADLNVIETLPISGYVVDR